MLFFYMVIQVLLFFIFIFAIRTLKRFLSSMGAVMFRLMAEEKYDKLPCILAKDPVIRYYGITQGNLIEITRDSVTMPGYPEITYRVVIGSNL